MGAVRHVLPRVLVVLADAGNGHGAVRWRRKRAAMGAVCSPGRHVDASGSSFVRAWLGSSAADKDVASVKESLRHAEGAVAIIHGQVKGP